MQDGRRLTPTHSNRSPERLRWPNEMFYYITNKYWIIKSTLNPENVSVQYLSVYSTLTLHHVIECTRKLSELSVQYRTHHCKQKYRRKLECCRQDTKEATICVGNKYRLIHLTNFYQINHNFSYFSPKTSHVTGSILNLVVVRFRYCTLWSEMQHHHST